MHSENSDQTGRICHEAAHMWFEEGEKSSCSGCAVDWYSEGRRFDPRSGHISFVEIDLVMI